MKYWNPISDKVAAAQANVLQEGLHTEMKTVVKDIDLLSNSSSNTTTASNTEEKKRADAKWLKDVRFAIEGVTQLLVGLVGLVGKEWSLKNYTENSVRANVFIQVWCKIVFQILFINDDDAFCE